MTTTTRIHNFSAGPCTLPLEVLERVAAEFVDYQQTGMSLVEMSHRSKPVVEVHEAALALVKELLGLGEDHEVLFLGGGATAQFSMAPMNLLRPELACDYTHSGSWAKKAIDDAKKFGHVHLLFDGTESGFSTLPDPASISSNDDAVYLHLTSNETIGGVQWKDFPDVDVPIVADMSSDIMSRKLPWEKFGIIYAGAQKNIGPAGVTLVIIRRDVLERCRQDLPLYLSYRNHAEKDSMLNTPPVFQIWVVKLVLEWLKGQGGLKWAEEMAAKRSGQVYQTIEQLNEFYRCPVDSRYRSTMNVVFRCPDETLESRFVEEASKAGLNGLKGHRSVGGCRASLYNAMPMEGVEALTQFMRDFAQANG